MKNKMEYVKVQMTTENIDWIKCHGSFAKVLNTLVGIAKTDDGVAGLLALKLKRIDDK